MEARKKNKTKGEQEKGVDNQIQTQQEQETIDQEELWLVQKRKQNKNPEQPTPKITWRPVSRQHRGTKDNRQHDETPSGIETVILLPHHPHINSIEIVVSSDEVKGGTEGGCQEKPTNMQEGVMKVGSLTHVLHEVVHTDHRLDLRAFATPISVQNSQNVQKNVNKNHKRQKVDTGQVQNDPGDPTDQNNSDPPGKGTTGNLQEQNKAQMQTPNNKSQGKISKKKRNAIKRRQEAEAARVHDEYNVVPSEDAYDQDTLSLGENDNEEDETSIHLIKAFGSTLHQEQLQEVTDQHGLSPMGRLKSKQANNNTSANSSRPNTRSRGRDKDIPWCTIGDINVITSTEEKQGGGIVVITLPGATKELLKPGFGRDWTEL
ncbi:hypothetical protein KY290_038310 [Solanum tuberosum]|uniref:Uncharacterized protein n=1 Tax=Solanum tuberosum TaxID=4113 RepID=A0ABQ7TYR0_SOLTU|nr:hypothetical protein KY290_038310 [Solanum tuberosum]